MSARLVNGLMFVLAGITPIVVYLGLGPDGAGILTMARTEQVFAYLFFSLPIAFMMLRKDETNNFLDAGLLILVASMSMGMVADALKFFAKGFFILAICFIDDFSCQGSTINTCKILV